MNINNIRTIMPGVSLADQIYQALREAIVNGHYPPGERLFEMDAAKVFSVSRTPVRESFRRLEQDGLVERVAAGGVKVVELSPEMVEDLFGLRTVLEEHAVELACQRITPEQIAELKQIKAAAGQVLADKSLGREYRLSRIFELNSQFHETIYQATNSRFLIKTLSYIRGIVHTMRTVSLRAETAPEEAWAAHAELIEHLEKHRVKQAKALIRKHMQAAVGQIMSVTGH